MKSFSIQKDQSEKHIDKVLKAQFPLMPISALYKAFRKKDIKVNGIRIKETYQTAFQDWVEVYISDEILFGKHHKISKVKPNQSNAPFSVVFENSHILIVNKRSGILTEPDSAETNASLIEYVQAYLSEKELLSKGFPALCHRLDRNTGGLVLIAKDSDTLAFLLKKIEQREIRKFYRCMVVGKMEKKTALLKSYLIKDAQNSRVSILDRPIQNSQEILTQYSTVSYLPEHHLSILDVELLTGRTHQIRAHLAHIGHPILGDQKYGSSEYNRRFKRHYQALLAYKLHFCFQDAHGELSDLNSKIVELSQIERFDPLCG